MALALPAFSSGQLASEAEIGIPVSKRQLLYDRGSTAISGRLRTSGPLAPSPAGRRIGLYAKPFPYRRARRVAVTRTDGSGEYRFGDVVPDYNTRYFVRSEESGLEDRSPQRLVFVYPRTRTTVDLTRNQRYANTAFRLVYSPKLPLDLSGKRTFWYFRKRGQDTFRVRDYSRTFLRRAGTLRSRGRIPLPFGRYTFFVSWCFETGKRRDIGLGPPESPDCPRRVQVRRERRSAGGGGTEARGESRNLGVPHRG